VNGFHSAAFHPDGELWAMQFKAYPELHQERLTSAHSFLNRMGPNFRASWGEDLADLETKLTAANGCALATFYVGGGIASSHLLLSGQDLETELQLAQSFVASLRRVRLVQLGAKSLEPFEEILQLKQRPLDVVVLWANPTAPTDRNQLAFDLSVHLAGAFFQAVSVPEVPA
jgi:hypothetical protein